MLPFLLRISLVTISLACCAATRSPSHVAPQRTMLGDDVAASQPPTNSRFEVDTPQLVSHSAVDPRAPTVGICFSPRLSPSGRFVLFTCQSSDVVEGEPGIGDLIQSDSYDNANRGVGLDTEGQWGYCQGAELGTCGSVGLVSDAAGQRAVFNSAAPLTPAAVQLIPGAGTPYVFLRDETAETTALLTPPPTDEASPAYMHGTDASIERSEILFTSVFNLTGGADSNGLAADLYVRNWIDGTVELISAAPDGHQGDSDTGFGVFSPDGRYVAFLSSASNLTGDNPEHLFNLFLRDRYLHATRRLTFPRGGGEFAASPFFSTLRITNDGRLLFGASGANFVSGDDPSFQNLYLLNLNGGALTQLPLTLDGLPPNESVESGDISDDGQRLIFVSAATNVASYGEVGVFLQDLASGETVSVSTTLGPLARPAGSSPPVAEISSDGSTLAFEWPSFDALFPTLLDNQQIYRVAVRRSAPQRAQAVPGISNVWIGVCSLLILAACWGGLRGRH